MPNIHVLILLMGLLLGRDLARTVDGQAANSPAYYLIACGWCAIIALVALAALPACARASSSRGTRGMFLKGLRFAQWLRWLLVVPFAIWSASNDVVGSVEAWLGSLIALDEIVAALPPLIALVCIAWAEHPLQDRMRQALVIRQLDEGGLPDRLPTRLEATGVTIRGMLAMPLLPVLLIVSWHELSGVLFRSSPGSIATAVDVAGTIAIISMAPAIIVRVLGTRPVVEGPLRDRVSALSKRMGTRVRGVRLWTHASANAALLGVLPFSRYVLVTDRLVQSMPRHELDAVLAHELAHSRQHHVLWILLSVLAAVLVLGFGQPVLAEFLRSTMMGGDVAEVFSVVIMIVAIVAWFGSVSRLIERQADAHAAVILGSEFAELHEAEPGVVHPAGPACMSASLDRVCELNGVSPERWGFRHGSVRQRQRALTALAGRPTRSLPVDRKVRAIKWATLLCLLGAGGYFALGIALNTAG